MGYRKQPFGYRMEAGSITVDPREAETVRAVFRAYLGGMTYRELVSMLKESPLRYADGKQWNINMVDRILKETRYTGARGFPPIIEEEQLKKAAAIRGEKVAVRPKSRAERALREMLGSRVPTGTEKRVLSMLNQLMRNPELLIEPGRADNRDRDVSEALLTSFEEQLEQPEVDCAAASQTAMEIAAEQYAEIGDSEYETERLRRLLGNSEPMRELDELILRTTVTDISVSGSGAIALTLRNGQIYE